MSCECEDGGGFAGARGAVEEEMWKSVVFDEAVDCTEDIGVPRDVGEGVWAVFLNPGSVTKVWYELGRLTDHGRLSSASTGRSATILLPFAFVLFEVNWIDFDGGPSMSISSSS